MRMQKPLRLTSLILLLTGAGSSALADGQVCAIEAPPLRIGVSAEPDDGSWGPTLEIVVEDAVQPLTRLIAQESRPVEACWWQVMKGRGSPALVIGVGANEAEAAGALVFVWREGRLEREHGHLSLYRSRWFSGGPSATGCVGARDRTARLPPVGSALDCRCAVGGRGKS